MSNKPLQAGDPAYENTDLMYKGLGHVVRAMHDALTMMGADDILAEASNEFPSARERLSHVAILTERAANTVLGKVEDTLPVQKHISDGADTLSLLWDDTKIESMSKEELLVLAKKTREFIGASRDDSLVTQQALSDIMMAQDFQDLTGQLIKKVVTLLERTESDLLNLLVSGAPAGVIANAKKEDMLAGPGAIGAVLMDQGNVDDLLADLGF
ncbi:MAG: protein phosphatase CheZ [Pseudomonadota bacterium]